MIIFLALITGAFSLFYPTQIHLSWTAEPGYMKVTWMSRLSSSGSVSYRPILCSLDSTWDSKDSTSSQHDFGDKILRYGNIHQAIMGPLDPSCLYEYKVANGLLESSVYLFNGQTHGEGVEKYSLIVFGDMGTHEVGQSTLDLIMSSLDIQKTLGIVHMGDIGYNLNYHQGNIGDQFLRMIEPLASQYAYMTIPGNHESSANYTHYINRFKMPENEASLNTSLFYSLNIGPVHYVFLHTSPLLKYKSAVERETIKNWLIKDLEEANLNRKKVPWIVTFQHHPLYCSHQPGDKSIRTDCEIQTSIVRHTLEELYYNNSVDLVLGAHVHHYERQSAIYKNETILSEVDEINLHVNSKAPIHIISGCAGNRLRKNDPKSLHSDKWSRFMSNDYGFGKITVLNSSTILWEQFSTETSKLLDYVYLVKDLD